jgi:hypothetical protein
LNWKLETRKKKRKRAFAGVDPTITDEGSIKAHQLTCTFEEIQVIKTKSPEIQATPQYFIRMDKVTKRSSVAFNNGIIAASVRVQCGLIKPGKLTITSTLPIDAIK